MYVFHNRVGFLTNCISIKKTIEDDIFQTVKYGEYILLTPWAFWNLDIGVKVLKGEKNKLTKCFNLPVVNKACVPFYKCYIYS